MAANETSISRASRSREQAQTAYDKLSRWYDLFTAFESAYREVGLQMLNVQEGERVLEIGFGTGHAIVTLARSVGDAGKVYGVDPSEGMLKRAQARVDKAGVADRAILHRGDAMKLGYAADFFDAVFMSFTLELFDTPEIPIVLRECRRVLRPGGRIGVVAMSKQGNPSWTMRLYEWAHRTFPAYVDCCPILARNALEEAGFRIENVAIKSMWGLLVEIVAATKR